MASPGLTPGSERGHFQTRGTWQPRANAHHPCPSQLMKEAPRRVSEGRQDGRETHKYLQGGFPHWCSGMLILAQEVRCDITWISVCHSCSSLAGAPCTQVGSELSEQPDLLVKHVRFTHRLALLPAPPCSLLSSAVAWVMSSMATARPSACCVLGSQWKAVTVEIHTPEFAWVRKNQHR